MNTKTSFKVGFIKAMALRGVTPDDFEKMAHSLTKQSLLGGIGVGAGLLANAGVSAGKGALKGSIHTMDPGEGGLGARIGGGVANVFPQLGTDEPLAKSIEQARGEALVMAYANAANKIRAKIETLREQRQKQEAARAQAEQDTRGGQELYEEITSK
tara:strand:- start:86 stop:556 length:471 start_codon:yes stop_codon:yes gene_type:complete